MTRIMQRLSGKVCVIVGAGSEIAAAVADRLTAEGGTVIGIDRHHHEIGDHCIIADMSEETAVEAAYAEIRDAHGKVDVIYNNAGLVDPTDLSALDTSVETMDRVFAANFTTAWLSC